jgi:hypothetical protein
MRRVRAIEAHDQFAPPDTHPTLYWVWDFVKRSKYMLSEYENIKNGRPLQYPDQFRPAPGGPFDLLSLSLTSAFSYAFLFTFYFYVLLLKTIRSSLFKQFLT